MQNDTIAPQPFAAPNNQQSHNAGNGKVSLGPFPHLKRGLSGLVKYNLQSGLVALLISSIVNTAITIAFMYAVFLSTAFFFVSAVTLSSGGTGMGGLVKVIAIFIGVAILAACITGYFGSVVTRIIITGSRGQKENVGHAFSFVLSRLPKIILTYLLVFAIIIAGAVLLGVMGRISPILTVLLSIVALVAFIIFGLRISYIPLVLVDDEDPGAPMGVLRRSATLWKRSGGALVVYYLLWFAVYIVFNMVVKTGDSSSVGYGSSSSLLQPSGFSFAIGAVLISSFISNCFGALVYSGAASIYNDARELVDGTRSGSVGHAAAPAPPTAAAPTAPQPPVATGGPTQTQPPQPPTAVK